MNSDEEQAFQFKELWETASFEQREAMLLRAELVLTKQRLYEFLNRDIQFVDGSAIVPFANNEDAEKSLTGLVVVATRQTFTHEDTEAKLRGLH